MATSISFKETIYKPKEIVSIAILEAFEILNGFGHIESTSYSGKHSIYSILFKDGIICKNIFNATAVIYFKNNNRTNRGNQTNIEAILSYSITSNSFLSRLYLNYFGRLYIEKISNYFISDFMKRIEK
ncbi:hypothetical protein [Spongiimicrobium sp. 2-473A-2-J]|uniref:hypothetical protein n=1 Tax=Eudoraea algarum TaxID=3417568 RepID=UPI003D35DE15